MLQSAPISSTPPADAFVGACWDTALAFALIASVCCAGRMAQSMLEQAPQDPIVAVGTPGLRPDDSSDPWVAGCRSSRAHGRARALAPRVSSYQAQVEASAHALLGPLIHRCEAALE